MDTSRRHVDSGSGSRTKFVSTEPGTVLPGHRKQIRGDIYAGVYDAFVLLYVLTVLIACAANFVACIPSQWITSSRIAWAFSRDVSLTPILTEALPKLTI